MYSPEKEHFVTVFDNITKRKQAEEDLRESERNFRLVTETIQDVFWMSTPDIGKIVYVSPAYEKIWGRTTESLYSSARSFWETIHPVDREHVASVLRQYHSKGKEYTCEYRIVLPDDSIRWILQRGFPICDEQGIFRFMCGVSTDITERKEAGELLAQSEQMLKGILFTSPVAIALTVDRKIKWVNQAWEETFGFEKGEYLGQDASIVYPSQAEYKRVGKELYPNLALGHVTQTDAKFIREDGSIFDGQIRMKAIDPSDPAKGTIAAITDISERKKAEEALRESEEKYRSLLEESFDGMFLTRGTKIVLTNSRLPRNTRL